MSSHCRVRRLRFTFIPLLLFPMPVLVRVVMVDRVSTAVPAALNGGRELREGSFDLMSRTRRPWRRKGSAVVW